MSLRRAAGLVPRRRVAGVQGRRRNRSVTLALVDTPSSHQTIDTLLPVARQGAGNRRQGHLLLRHQPQLHRGGVVDRPGRPRRRRPRRVAERGGLHGAGQGLRQLQYKGDIFTAACTDYIKTSRQQAAGGALYSSNWLPAASKYAPADVQRDLALAEKYISAVERRHRGLLRLGPVRAPRDFAKAMSTAPERRPHRARGAEDPQGAEGLPELPRPEDHVRQPHLPELHHADAAVRRPARRHRRSPSRTPGSRRCRRSWRPSRSRVGRGGDGADRERHGPGRPVRHARVRHAGRCTP